MYFGDRRFYAVFLITSFEINQAYSELVGIRKYGRVLPKLEPSRAWLALRLRFQVQDIFYHVPTVRDLNALRKKNVLLAKIGGETEFQLRFWRLRVNFDSDFDLSKFNFVSPSLKSDLIENASLNIWLQGHIKCK